MKNSSLFDRCKANTNIDNDVFVGIHHKDDFFEVNFPLGYHLSNDEKGLRKDILSLLSTLSQNTEKKESEIHSHTSPDNDVSMPITAYLYLIKDFFERGYYKERENYKKVAKRGKIDWARTIKTQKPFFQDKEVFYLDFVVKKNVINENELITLVHKFCVYESFEKFGWLFTSYVPFPPKIKLSKAIMISIVNNKLQNTYNDRNKQLFKNMIAIINSLHDEANSEFRYGTYRFEYVWEKMIDKIFGISDKEEYFPKTKWNLGNGKIHNNAFLEPDTIMIINDKIFVLDAKYYKYGWSYKPGHLPESTSINKQITYGEYIAKAKKFMHNGNHPTVYNAFIMPYDSHNERYLSSSPIHYIGTATSDWKNGEKKYEHVMGILMDVKYLMELNSQTNISEIIRLAEMIEEKCPV